MTEKRELPKPIEKELDDFMEIVCEGIRGEYEKGWSCRKLKEDKRELKKYVSFCMNWAYGSGKIDGQAEFRCKQKLIKNSFELEVKYGCHLLVKNSARLKEWFEYLIEKTPSEITTQKIQKTFEKALKEWRRIE